MDPRWRGSCYCAPITRRSHCCPSRGQGRHPPPTLIHALDSGAMVALVLDPRLRPLCEHCGNQGADATGVPHPGPQSHRHSAHPCALDSVFKATLWVPGATTTGSTSKSQTWYQGSLLGHNFPCGREEIQKSPEAFAMKDPNSPHYRSGHLPHWLQRIPVVFAKADLSWWTSTETTALCPPWSSSCHIPPSQCPCPLPISKVFPHWNQSTESGRSKCPIQCIH